MGQWSVVSGQWSVVSGQWSVVSGQLSVVSGQWSVVSGQWSVVSGQWSVVSCQWSVVREPSQSFLDNSRGRKPRIGRPRSGASALGYYEELIEARLRDGQRTTDNGQTQ